MSTGIGEALRQARQEQGRSIEDAADVTRVRGDYLRALEDERFAAITVGATYAQGFLRSYARYLDLDPEPLLDTYRREVAAGDDASPAQLVGSPVATRPPRNLGWLVWLVVAGLAVVAVVAASDLFGGRVPAPSAAPTLAPPAAATPAAEEVAAEPTVAPTAAPTPSPVFEGVNVLLAFEEDCWVRVEVDGEQIEQGVIARGETRSYEAGDGVTIRFGNPGGVQVELNDDDLGAAGQRGQPNTVLFTPDGSEVVA